MEAQTTPVSTPVALQRQQDANGEKLQIQSLIPGELSKDNAEDQPNQEHQYVTGLKLAIVIGSLTLVFFVVMLDLSIIVTVRKQYRNNQAGTDTRSRLSLVSQVTFNL